MVRGKIGGRYREDIKLLNMLDYILGNPWLAALVIFISQIAFMFLRTLNVIFTAKIKLLPTITTGIGLDITWLVSMSIGLSSVMTGDWQPVTAFILGSMLGRYWGIKKETKRNKDV